jgi:hypothetical protein
VADLVDLNDLDLSPEQRRAEQVLMLRRGLRGEAVADAEQLAEWWPWIVGCGRQGCDC